VAILLSSITAASGKTLSSKTPGFSNSANSPYGLRQTDITRNHMHFIALFSYGLAVKMLARDTVLVHASIKWGNANDCCVDILNIRCIIK